MYYNSLDQEGRPGPLEAVDGRRANTRRFRALLVSTLARDDIAQSSTDVAMSATHNVLNDEEVGKHAAFWMQQVLGDSNIQKKSGEHLWNAFTYAINPFGRGTQSDAGVKTRGDKPTNVGKSNHMTSEAETKATK